MNNMPQKMIVTIYTEEKIYSNDDVPIDQFLKLVQKNKDAGATTVNIDSDDDSSDVEINFYYDREETDDEMANRIKKWEEAEEASRKNKIRQFEMLKRELGY